MIKHETGTLGKRDRFRMVLSWRNVSERDGITGILTFQETLRRKSAGVFPRAFGMSHRVPARMLKINGVES